MKNTSRVPKTSVKQKPRMFIGSSVEGIEVARAVQSELQHEIEVTLWNQHNFPPSKSTLDSLLRAVYNFDAGLFVFAADDVGIIRGKKHLVPRDNVLFECGLFFGKLGTTGSFFLIPRGVPKFQMPSDLWGITPLSYDPSFQDGNIQAAVGPACSDVRKVILNGPRSELSGQWIQEWRVKGSKNYEPINNSKAWVQVRGDRFSASFDHLHGTLQAHATISDERFVTGEWSSRKGGVSYHGAFQLYISPIGNRMTGKWVGFKSNNRVDTGDWVWTRERTKR